MCCSAIVLHNVSPIRSAQVPLMALFAHIPALFLDKVVGLLLPLFLNAAEGDTQAARHTVLCMLASYDVETEQEIRLAAEIASFSFGALEALGRAMDPDLPLNASLRLRGSANSMHRSAHQCERTLDRVRKQRQKMAPTAAVSAQTTDQTEPCQPAQAAAPPALRPSRQERRMIERVAKKTHRQNVKQVSNAAMRTGPLGPSDLHGPNLALAA